MRNFKPALALLAALMSGHLLAAPAASVNGEIINESDLEAFKKAELGLGTCGTGADISSQERECARSRLLKTAIHNVLDRQHFEQLTKDRSLEKLPEFATFMRLAGQNGYWYAAALAQPVPQAVTEQQIADLYKQKVEENSKNRQFELQRVLFSNKGAADHFLASLQTNKRAFSERPNPLQPESSRDIRDSVEVTLPQMQEAVGHLPPHTVIYFIALIVLPFYFQYVSGMSPIEIGVLITPWPAALVIVAPIAGRLADRYSAGILGGVGLAVMTAGLLLVLTMPADPARMDVAWRLARKPSNTLPAAATKSS